MILPARAPLEPTDRPLRALYRSLNGPVVTLEAFPSGPARAAVALHAEGATLCVRSLRTSQVRFFTTARALAGDGRVAADAALSFAESMGFLFDDDEVTAGGDRGAEIATARWQELCGEGPETAGDFAPAPRSIDAADALQEILLEETLALETPPTPPPVLLLSKFRRRPASGMGPGGGSEGALPDPRLRLMSRF